MKFKDILIGTFLAGLLIYSFSYRAGLVGNYHAITDGTSAAAESLYPADTLTHGQWIFTAHPDKGLKISTLSGEIVYRNPEFRSGLAGIDAQPDTTGVSLGMLVVRSDCGLSSTRFRILSDGTLEII